MKVVTAQQMQALDRYTIEEIGLPGLVLMENAGREVTAKIRQYFPDLKNMMVAIVCGKGNNGGDGFVVARHLAASGVRVKIFLLAKTEALSGEARTNCLIAGKLGLPIQEILSPQDIQECKADLPGADLLVDAIFGTGLTPPVRGLAAEVIELLNRTDKPIISVDIPSGLSSDAARPDGPHIRAALTVTLALPKLAHMLPPACQDIGRLEIVDIGIPAKALQQFDLPTEVIEPDLIRDSWPPRSPGSHKGTYGHLLVLAGSPGKTGAAYMAAQSAARTGAGLVTLGIPESLSGIMAAKLTEVMTLPLAETEHKTFSIKAKEAIEAFLPKAAAVAIGPGLSTHPEVKELVTWLIRRAEVPLVIDADGINVLAGQAHILREAKQPPILTPHPRELSRLIERDPASILGDRLAVVRQAAQEFHCYLTLKGYRTLSADPDGRVVINPTGNPGMASGGMGDILTGILGGLLAQGFPKDRVLPVGVFIHGLLGDRVREEKGECGLLATDLIDLLPSKIEQLRFPKGTGS